VRRTEYLGKTLYLNDLHGTQNPECGTFMNALLATRLETL